MKKDDSISIFLSIIINILIVLAIPTLSSNKIENKKIKIGLVSYDNNMKTKLEGRNNNNGKDKKITEKITQKQEQVKEKNENKTKPTEKAAENKPKKDPNKVDLSALNNIAQTIKAPKVDIMSVANSKHKSSKIKTPKKELTQMKSPVNSPNLSKDIVLEKEPLPEKTEDLALEKDQLSFNSEIGKDNHFNRILHSSDGKEGLPSGYRLGTEDGDIVARWDNSNKEPVYPESAQMKGLHGSVKIRMNIDENGNVKNLKLEKGSGVPEINNAIEQVGRTWKIYLSKNGLNVTGDVILEYNFILK